MKTTISDMRLPVWWRSMGTIWSEMR